MIFVMQFCVEYWGIIMELIIAAEINKYAGI